MDRTLFSPAMIQTYQKCKKAYELRYLKSEQNGVSVKLSTVTKRFLKKGFAEVHKGNVTSVTQAQQWLGKNWPNFDNKSDSSEPFATGLIDAFRFAYRVLTNYVARPYKPSRAEVRGVNLKLRARIPQTSAYIEDVFDLLLWHPDDQTLEIVDYHISQKSGQDHAWPDADLLIKQFLSQKMQSRIPFKRLKLTYAQILPSGVRYQSEYLDDALFQEHWPEVVRTVEEMKSASEFRAEVQELCQKCPFAGVCPSKKPQLVTCEERRDITYRSA